MFDRYSLYDAETAVRKFFGKVEPTHVVQYALRAPSRDILPMQAAPVVRISSSVGRPELAILQWGLLPSWCASPDRKNRRVSILAGLIEHDASTSDAFAQRRCLVLADGFYEAHGIGDQQACFRMTPGPRECFAFAGLWDRWPAISRTLPQIETFAVIVKDVARRAASADAPTPVLIREENYSVWLEGDPADAMKLVDDSRHEEARRYLVGTMQ